VQYTCAYTTAYGNFTVLSAAPVVDIFGPWAQTMRPTGLIGPVQGTILIICFLDRQGVGLLMLFRLRLVLALRLGATL